MAWVFGKEYMIFLVSGVAIPCIVEGYDSDTGLISVKDIHDDATGFIRWGQVAAALEKPESSENIAPKLSPLVGANAN